MSDLRILYVASEMEPFLETSSVANLVRKLSKTMRAKEAEVRILVPRFGVINERRNRLHEVARLSGINVTVSDEYRPLIIKVASIREERLQVYFVDNEEYFQRKSVFTDKKGIFFKDNDERIIFFCKGVLETIKQLEWSPNVVHCNDWISALIPMYLKTTHKNEPMFKSAKTLFTVYPTSFSEKFDETLFKKENITLKQEDHNPATSPTVFTDFIKLGAQYADLVTHTDPSMGNELDGVLRGVDSLYTPDQDGVIVTYDNLYEQLIKS